jgi:hypothetical protein
MKDTTGTPDSTETAATGDSHTVEGRRGPSWKGWVLSLLVAVILSVTATLLLGGSGAGSSCCPTADAGK